jgi:hypothetical protein
LRALGIPSEASFAQEPTFAHSRTLASLVSLLPSLSILVAACRSLDQSAHPRLFRRVPSSQRPFPPPRLQGPPWSYGLLRLLERHRRGLRGFRLYLALLAPGQPRSRPPKVSHLLPNDLPRVPGRVCRGVQGIHFPISSLGIAFAHGSEARHSHHPHRWGARSRHLLRLHSYSSPRVCVGASGPRGSSVLHCQTARVGRVAPPAWSLAPWLSVLPWPVSHRLAVRH